LLAAPEPARFGLRITHCKPLLTVMEEEQWCVPSVDVSRLVRRGFAASVECSCRVR
jgi:hypothetical protein